MKALHMVAFILLIVGGLNWGLIGLGAFMNADWDVVSMVLGSWPQVEWLVFVLVGLSAIWIAIGHKGDCKMCASSM